VSDRSLPGIHPERRGTPVWVYVVGLAVAAVVLSVIIGFSVSGRPDPTEKYAQTWHKDYSNTSCSEWSGQMSEQQRFAASADMLTAARNKMDGGSGVPNDSLIDEFTAGLDTVCVDDAANIAELAVLLYTTEPRFAP
jgi:hypothetical protein